ncbi:hypothetical protein HHL08_08175 [Sphingobium sp. AR-3-1]|uniref:Uncharacterized protein n=1 Tax=Sphingobium psychrophilum TaxID=2728834 RepID=A0A7X9WUF7_9SPHN|nr:hypothetical protein [Sphingobium psychrophilum]NML10131.1 hypothetical protein [Sphingobium psychrophilum]
MTDRKDMTAAYYKALDLPKSLIVTRGDEKHIIQKKAALDRAHEMRRFEIENYWKRATYFWSFQAIAFVVLGFIFKDGNPPKPLQIIQLPAAIGAVSGFIGWLSAKGSKYWQENWESHVDSLEHDIEGKLTQTIWSNGKRSFSVSRLNQAFMAVITLAWLVAMTIPIINETILNWIVRYSANLSLGLLLAIFLYIWIASSQKITGYMLNQDSWIGSSTRWHWNWNWKRLGEGKEKRQLILRHTHMKDAEQPDD